MTDEIGIPATFIPLLSVAISATLPVILVQLFKSKEKKDILKAEEVRIKAETTARELKKSTEENAIGIKQAADKVAYDLKLSTQQIASDLIRQSDIKNAEIMGKLDNFARIIDDIGKQLLTVAKHVEDVSVKQVDMGKSMEQMINNLRSKADLTNGNVERIRNEVLDLEESIDIVYEKIEGNEMSDRDKREKKKLRDKKRREIAETSVSQHKSNQGDSPSNTINR